MTDRLAHEIRETIAAQFRRPLEEITPDTSLFKELAQDSLAIVEAVMALEQRFNVTIDDSDLQRLGRVADLTQYILQRSSAGRKPV